MRQSIHQSGFWRGNNQDIPQPRFSFPWPRRQARFPATKLCLSIPAIRHQRITRSINPPLPFPLFPGPHSRLKAGPHLFTFRWHVRCLHVAQTAIRSISRPTSYDHRTYVVYCAVGRGQVGAAWGIACCCGYANEDTRYRWLARLICVGVGVDESIAQITTFCGFQSQVQVNAVVLPVLVRRSPAHPLCFSARYEYMSTDGERRRLLPAYNNLL